MTQSDRERLFAKFNGNLPANAIALREFEAESHIGLPDNYSKFLEQMNGGEGFIGNAYIILWRVEELLDMNNAYQVSDYAPGLFLIGSDGGGEAFAIDSRSDADPIVSVPFVGMELKLARPIAPDFKMFLETLFKS